MSLISFLLCLSIIPGYHSYSCNPAICLPKKNCYCASKALPSGLSLTDTPQFIVFTLDDSIYQRDFDNPNCFNRLNFFLKNESIKDSIGCNPKLSWYAMQTWTDFNVANYLSKAGHLVNIHSFSHMTSSSTLAAIWKLEEETDSNNLQKLGQIPKPIGSRPPYLQSNDAYFAQVQSMDVQFDSSMPYHPPQGGSTYWPFTLDYGVPDPSMCNVFTACPQKNYPGLWEFPMTNFDYAHYENVMDPDITDYAGQMQKFKDSFLATYNSNRAPRGFYWHWRYLTSDGNFGGLASSKAQFLTDFYQWLSTFPNVIFTTEDKIMNWMKNPAPYSKTITQPDFQCAGTDPNLTPDNSCPQGKITCIYGFEQIQVCATSCPDNWPGMGVSWDYIDPLHSGQTDALQTHWIGKATLVNVQESATSFCANIQVTNSGKTTAVAFVFSLLSCPTNSLIAWLDFNNGNSESYYSIGANKGFTLLGSNNPDPSPSPYIPISIPAGSSVFIGGFCLDERSASYNLNNSLVMGIDLYSENVNCEINSCKKFCGDRVCSASQGENSTNCPIDCKLLKCPT